VERSRQKTELLKGYGDTFLGAEALEKELEKSKKLRVAPIQARWRLHLVP
jgi:hypothetical protein